MADFEAATEKRQTPDDLDLIEIRYLLTRPQAGQPVEIQGKIEARLITPEKGEHSRPSREFEELPTAWQNADITTWTTRWNAIRAKLLPAQ